jgi:chromosome segregation ATPase
MGSMAERRQEAARVLRQHEVPPADATAQVDVEELLAKLADLTAELAEARVRQEHAEANLKTQTRELESERKAHRQTKKQLEGDRRALEAERDELVAACGELEPQLAEQRERRSAAEAELKRAEERSEALQHQWQVVRAQLQQQPPEEPSPWWRRSGS